MAEQMTLFGIWERVEELEPEPVAAEPLALPAEPPPVPVLPGQTDLLTGLHAERRRMELALQALDPGELRAAWQQAHDRYPGAREADDWPRWADGLEHQLGMAAAPLSGTAQASRARELFDPETAGQRFPRLAPPLLVDLRRTLLRRAHDALVAEQGPAARLDDGRAAGVLLLEAGDAAGAVRSLHAALEGGRRDARTMADLATALARSGRMEMALVAWRDALLQDPAVVEEAELQGTPLYDLLDEIEELELPGPPLAWLPALADLAGIVRLPARLTGRKRGGEGSGKEDGETAPARTFAVLVCRLRQTPRDGAHAAERAGIKREMLRKVPGLRGRVEGV